MSTVKRLRTAFDGLSRQFRPTSFSKFNRGPPNDQTTLDIFKGHWASEFPDVNGVLTAGNAPLFTSDPRPRYALRAFGARPEQMQGARVLELGPLEGGHTYQLEGLGANVLGVEGNAEAYLKCLIAKELLGLQARFLYGDFLAYLDDNPPQLDLIFACGVLYHMTTPLRLIRSICENAPRAFIWTHYYDPDLCIRFSKTQKSESGLSAAHYRRSYFRPGAGLFFGGLENHACWLPREELINAFSYFGHKYIEIIEETRDHPHGPCFSFVTSAQPF